MPWEAQLHQGSEIKVMGILGFCVLGKDSEFRTCWKRWEYCMLLQEKRFVSRICNDVHAHGLLGGRLFSVLRFESVIHEYDPYFNYRSTVMLVEKGFYEFRNWYDHESWYPLGRIVGATVSN
eukprot:1177494-Prorocentrum_minimum.AAC.2